MVVGALSGYRVGVTADRRREEQAELLTRRGAAVLHGPVIRTLPLDDEAALACATRRLVEEPPDLVVLSTALGVRGWLSAAESLGLGGPLLEALSRAEVWARGPKAAGAAVTAGLPVTWVAPEATGRQMVEALARRRTNGVAAPGRVAVQLDGAPGAPLADEITALGYEVVAVPVYRWLLPEDLGPAHRLVSAVADRSLDAVTFTSAHAVANFERVARHGRVLDDVRRACVTGEVVPVAVGPVSAARVAAAGLGDAVQPDHPRLGAMVQALAVHFRSRAVEVSLAGRAVRVQGRLVVLGEGDEVVLTERERAVLEVLAAASGAVVSKPVLRRRVWPAESDDHVVEVTVGRLRRRLGDAGSAIETVPRRGYRLGG